MEKNNKKYIMNDDFFTDALIDALAKPDELSGHCYPDGTLMTNFEYYKKLKEFN